MATVEKDYEELLRLFNRHRVRYCIVGAFAVAFYAVPRYTKDMDLFVEPNPVNAQKIVKALEEFGFSEVGLKAADFSQKGKTIQLGFEPVRVDLVTAIDGRQFDDVWKRRKKGTYGRQKVYFISLEDLIQNKRASGRAQDQADLKLLQRRPHRA